MVRRTEKALAQAGAFVVYLICCHAFTKFQRIEVNE